jgi:hypothetical protein
MPALDTLGQYVTESRRPLQDEVEPYRYPDADLVDALNIGLMEARRLRADLFLPLFTQPFFDASGAIDMDAAVTFDPMYRSSLVFYIVGRIQLRDDEPTTDQRAAGLMQKFTQQMLAIAS